MKKTFSVPALTVHGNVVKLTLGGRLDETNDGSSSKSTGGANESTG